MQALPLASGIVAFGPFQLAMRERLLTKAGLPVKLGSRALELLIALLERADVIVGKQELLGKVWPDVTVTEDNLRVQVASLRKALGDGVSGTRYIVTSGGRGYRFVAPISAGFTREPKSTLTNAPALPRDLRNVIGRDGDVQEIIDRLGGSRLVNVIGSGGIGKTTVAVKAGHALLPAFGGLVRFVDLGPVGDPLLVSTAVASALELVVLSDGPMATLQSYLCDKRLLLILDSCEHVIDAVAALIEVILASAPELHILVTSRETLRVAGETLFELPPLQAPPSHLQPSADAALSFSAVQLFVERTQASASGFELTDAEAPIVAEICRRLDGIALAIELAASHVDAYGVRQTARMLGGELELRWRGRRTAVPRHQTLSATLDWSYDLLPEAERELLRRLSILTGLFDLDAALAVRGGEDPDSLAGVHALVELVNKSLVAITKRSGRTWYRLLDTTRAYASAKLVSSQEFEAVAHRRATHFLTVLERIDGELTDFSKVEALRYYDSHLGNIRSALEWSFGAQQDNALRTALAAAAVRFFLQLSLLTECRRWAQQALDAMDGTARGTLPELVLQASLGQALMFTQSHAGLVEPTLLRALALAEALQALPHQIQMLGALHLYYQRIADFHRALALAEKSAAVARLLGDKRGVAAAHSYLGISHHFMGRFDLAHEHFSAALADSGGPAGFQLGFDHRNRVQVAMARNLFLRGFPDQAIRMTRDAVADAAALDHPLTLCMALIWGVAVHTWVGDLDTAEATIGRFLEQAERHSLVPYYALGAAIQGDLAIRRGAVEAGLRTLRDALERLHADRYDLLRTNFLGALAEGFARAGRFEAALATVSEAVELASAQGDVFIVPDLLRIRAEVLLASWDPRGAETQLLRAIDLSRSQGSLAWELRAATTLARLWVQRGRSDAARDLLKPVYDRFDEGRTTADLRTARQLLTDLG